MQSSNRPDDIQLRRELVERLSRDVRQESCVLFVGGGSTTEKWRLDHNFYSRIRDMAGIGADAGSVAFPDVMQTFCEKRDGGHHNLLVREAIRYLEPFLLPGPAHAVATEFCSLISRIPYFKTIVTTNWDPLLERALDVLVPITEDRDLAFWNDRKRQVIKLHGSITRPHSIVATRTDYDSCLESNALVFNKLRDLMATKTFLFTGYSLKDPDFRAVWESITSRLGRFTKLAYALDPFASQSDEEYWKERGIQIFRIRDVQFASDLRKDLIERGLIPSEQLVNFLMRQRQRIYRIHLATRQTSDGTLSSALYQDGLLHQLDDLLDGIQLGTMKTTEIEGELAWALNTLKKMTRKNDIFEIAYWTGRLVAVQSYFEEQRPQIPAYFHPYRLQPISKLMKGASWPKSLPKKRARTLRGKMARRFDDSQVVAMCRDCARKMHAPRGKKHT